MANRNPLLLLIKALGDSLAHVQRFDLMRLVKVILVKAFKNNLVTCGGFEHAKLLYMYRTSSRARSSSERKLLLPRNGLVSKKTE